MFKSTTSYMLQKATQCSINCLGTSHNLSSWLQRKTEKTVVKKDSVLQSKTPHSMIFDQRELRETSRKYLITTRHSISTIFMFVNFGQSSITMNIGDHL